MSKVLIIAEIGVNHNGDLQLAKQMIDEASSIGADVVKFQCFVPEALVVPNAPKAEYQKSRTQETTDQLEMLRQLALKKEEIEILIDYCKQKGILFLCSPFDIESIDMLHQLGVEIFKIPSGQITDYPYLLRIAQLEKKVILSTGMATIAEIRAALEVLREGCDEITLLHCTSEYPAPYDEVNLKAMLTLKKIFGLPVGYSDHTIGIAIPVAATSLGACVIEKHFTLDRRMKGPDHGASLEAELFRKMIEDIRLVESALGDGYKVPTSSELKNRDLVRKSIVAITPIRKDECFTTENIGTRRAGGGMSPMLWGQVIGQLAPKDYEENECIIL